MADDTVDLLSDVATISEWSEDLIGYEPASVPLNPRDPDDADHFRRLVADAEAAGRDVRAVLSDGGHLVLWQRPDEPFWSPL